MAKKLWGGRFEKVTDPLVEKFTRSIQFDHKLVKYDLLGSIAHVYILKRAHFLTPQEANKLTKALKEILENVETFRPDLSVEDVHTQIQGLVEKKVGDLALKLHTARSRNEQVVFATKLYCKDMIANLQDGISGLKNEIESLGEKNKYVIIPGFTHLQHAQPIYLKDDLLAYTEMLKRDYDRLSYISENIKLTLGAGASAGTPINTNKYNIKVGKLNVQAAVNSLDSVSDRDFVIEILNALAILGMHLSRLAEDLIIWSTKEFDFIEIDEAFCTGSSLMPQKKNPDVLELIRGYAGRLSGNLISVMTMMKGLPLTYNRDLQLDKEPLFDSFKIVTTELKVLAGLIRTLKFNKAKIEEHLDDEALYATDLMYYLVEKGVPFKNAHTIVGRLIKYSIDNSIEIKSMTDRELKKFSDKFVAREIIRLFNPKVSVESKKSIKRKI